MSKAAHLIFVYGTLRREASNAFRMEGAEFKACGLIKGRLYVVDWYPAFVREGGDGWVEGELWKVDDDQLRLLDEFEGDEYQRVRVDVRLQQSDGDDSWDTHDGCQHKAWAWEWLGSVENLHVIKSGDWMDVEKPRPPKVYTCMGCVVMPAIPVGSLIILSWIQDHFGSASYLRWPIGGLVLLTPVVSLMLIRLGRRRRESGKGLQETVVVISLLWAAISILVILEFYFGYLILFFR